MSAEDCEQDDKVAPIGRFNAPDVRDYNDSAVSGYTLFLLLGVLIGIALYWCYGRFRDETNAVTDPYNVCVNFQHNGGTVYLCGKKSEMDR